MGDTKVVDARGLACPQPVVLTKQALEINEKVTVLVDNETALENIKRLGTKLGFAIKVETKKDSTFEIKLKRKKGVVVSSCSAATAAAGPFIIVISANTMGQGNDELGSVLIRSFLHTVAEQSQKPDTIIFYNTGVKLTVEGSEVLDDLKQLESAGVQLLVCGTCLNYFEIKDKLAAGTVSNMYDILDAMSRAGRLLTP
ncbi:MAG: sulfurtransferase-like selenium metabolism protein YedF [Smithella sp.]|nr:sulfurtransferase-like selenium metabolism protein YedF [Smithella sp.]MDM7988327.1 sulfurtransferase-like selenium metabolism protein YedF [Smithella sp.]HOU50215.1 sulfurtransferase-like selenium metabolism protein YedF [Smithella sp.]HQG66930.1 sulfurtransferase-like selenium metabolism protein YedF [Smithella sp.]HQI72201.1 sulfurtransferase-like selenium metabolism protein YedF [Smithella sp.]